MSIDVQPVTREMSQDRINAYAHASDDHNPIHVDESFARGTPFGGTIAHGMLVLAVVGEMMHAAHGQAWTSSGRLKVRFKAPTRSGETVTASATLLKALEGRAEYAIQCATQAGEVVIEGRASVAVGA
jgi:3-hydroxybutyryl-CoA dehydratase